MKYILAVLAIIAEFFVYSMISVAMGWRAGGGAFSFHSYFVLSAKVGGCLYED